MIKDRILEILRVEQIKMPLLESLTGISRYTWHNLKNPAKARGIREEEILAICKVFPQYRWWLLTGEEIPQVNQVRPIVKTSDGQN